MYNHHFEDIPYDEIPLWDLVGQPEYTASVYANGVLNPVLVATWKGKKHLVGGHRRILSLKEARHQAEEDGTLADRPWLDKLPALIFDEVPPEVQTAWALQDNEERSDNPLHTYLIIKAAQEAGDWGRVSTLYQVNKARLKVIMEYEKLTPELLAAVMEGRISKTNALRVARLGARQNYALELARARDPERVRITGSDIKAASQARATAVLQVISHDLVPAAQANLAVDRPSFLIADEQLIEELMERGALVDVFAKAFEASQQPGYKLYRLVEV